MCCLAIDISNTKIMIAESQRHSISWFSRSFSLLIGGLLTLSVTLVSCHSSNPPDTSNIGGIKTKVLRMGYQSVGDVVRARQVLEKRLKPLGITVEWAKFTAGPELLEAMNVGSLDIGAVGETPPIFAQESGIPFVYLASTKPGNGQEVAIVVRKDSPIKTVADLKGKSLAFERATAGEYFAVKVLEEAGLKLSDVKYVNLIAAEARAALFSKSIDAAVVNDPNLTIYQKTIGVRILRNGKGIRHQGGYYLVARSFVKENPALTKIILAEINNVGKWAEAHPQDVAKIIAADSHLDLATLETIVKRRHYTLRPINDGILSGQQQIADFFYENKFISKKINVKDAALSPAEYAAITPAEIKP